MIDISSLSGIRPFKDLGVALDGLEPLSLGGEERLELIDKFADALNKFKDKYISIAAKEINKPASESEEERETTLQLLEGDRDLMFLKGGKETGAILGILPFDTPLLSLTKLWLFALAQNRPLILKPSSHAVQTTLEIARLFDMPNSSFRILDMPGTELGSVLSKSSIPTIYVAGQKSSVASVSDAVSKSNGITNLISEQYLSTIAVASKGSDVDQVVGETIENAFAFNGQYCGAQKGLLVHVSMQEELVEKLKERLALYVAPYPAHQDEATVTQQVDRSDENLVNTAISDSIAEGAEILAGGSGSDKLFYPTIVTSLKPERKLVNEDFRAPYLWIESYDEHPDEYLQAIKKEKRVVVYGESTTLQGRLEATLNWDVVNRSDLEAVLPHQWPNPLTWLSTALKGK